MLEPCAPLRVIRERGGALVAYADKGEYVRFPLIMVVVSLFLVMASVDTATGQACGPACPVCSGKAVGDLLPPATVFGSALYIPDGEAETAVFNLRYGLFSWMDAGHRLRGRCGGGHLECSGCTDCTRCGESASGAHPGDGSVQARGADQSAFGILAKTMEIVEGRFAVGLAAGYATDLPDFEEDWGLGTLTLTFFDRASRSVPYLRRNQLPSRLGGFRDRLADADRLLPRV